MNIDAAFEGLNYYLQKPVFVLEKPIQNVSDIQLHIGAILGILNETEVQLTPEQIAAFDAVQRQQETELLSHGIDYQY